MTDLNCLNVMGMLKGDFGALWRCRQVGKSLEITTSYLYPDNTFVVLYATKRQKRFIVADGGQASDFFHCAKDDEPFFASLIGRAKLGHDVLEHSSGTRRFYYKQTTDFKLISSIAFDLANFLVAATNAAILSTAEDDAMDKNSFKMRADKFIKPLIKRGRTVKFSGKLEEVKEATFSAVIKSSSKLWLVIYLTGSNAKYFQLSTSNAIVNVELLKASSINRQVERVIPFLNDEAMGYQPNQLTQRLARLSELTKNEAIPWRRKDEIISKLAA
jgi:hypothetical protein